MGQVGERLGLHVGGHILSVDFQPLEERLVEQAALLRPGLNVGPLNLVGQRQRVVQGFEDLLVFEAQLLDGLGCADALPADPGLLVGEQGLAHAVGVVGVQQLAFLLVEPGQHGFGVGDLLSRQLGNDGDVRLDGFAYGLALRFAQFDFGVVALDGGFDGFHPMVGLRAAALLPTAAYEVVVEPAVAFDLRVEQSPAALAAVEAAAQVVEVPPGAFAADALGVEQVLDLLKGLLTHQRLVPPFVGLAAVVDDARVVGVAQHRRQPVAADRLGGSFAARPGPQAPVLQDRRQLRERVVAGGVEQEGFAHQWGALRVEDHGADFAAVHHLAGVLVADGRFVGRAALFGLLRAPLDDLGCQVAAVELRDGGHDAVQQ